MNEKHIRNETMLAVVWIDDEIDNFQGYLSSAASIMSDGAKHGYWEYLRGGYRIWNIGGQHQFMDQKLDERIRLFGSLYFLLDIDDIPEDVQVPGDWQVQHMGLFPTLLQHVLEFDNNAEQIKGICVLSKFERAIREDQVRNAIALLNDRSRRVVERLIGDRNFVNCWKYRCEEVQSMLARIAKLSGCNDPGLEAAVKNLCK